ncbi:hypothetical protein [Azospirillum doebereinerae]|uniref:DUF4149 domain-containing protein n=1 Tax=Azospirillum doebereinerae TaxID=92933 RepID=A0A433JE07_9PROT|nr:hypothetical protein [Azospirillum doebereinerae]MCG5239245.1 hypothetical protein [Azospirillum doebereinerae]RUQ75119.1 hypothetical protein EJ913_04510 [Azospirillum doebereinerae]
MDSLSSSSEGRLLVAAFGILVFLVGLALLGERTLPLFGGDRDMARRVYKTLFVGLGGAMVSLAVPALVTGGVARARTLFGRIDAKGAVADFLLRDRVPEQAQTAGFALMAVFAVASVVAAVAVWSGER